MAGHDTPLGADEPIDRVPGQPELTAWKQAARRHQNAWREAHEWPPGERPGRAREDGTRGLIGSRIAPSAADAGKNFLTPEAWTAAKKRVEARQARETLDATRLYGDLLSSMPMCFNLFGPLAENPTLASEVANRWFPDVCPAGAPVTVCFEWSPGRGDDTWLGDRTAFDAAFFIDPDGARCLIGIETKYHEHPVATPLTTKDKKTGTKKERVLKSRYLEVSKVAALADEATIRQEIWGRPVEQVWRDHLLALACGQQADKPWNPVQYVLVAPEGNPAWQPLVEQYVAIAPNAAETCGYRSLESLLDTADDLLPYASLFGERYLDVVIDPTDGI